MRQLGSGKRFEIIKNFYDGPALARLFAPWARNLVFEEVAHFWVLTYLTRA